MSSRKADKRSGPTNRKPQKLSTKSRQDAAKATATHEQLQQGPSSATVRESHSRYDPVQSAMSYWTSAAASRMKPIELATTRSSASAAVIDKAHAVIDAEIEAALVAVLSMRSRHYMLSPISTLPEEVLALIFDILSQSDSFHTAPLRTTWVAVTFVCRVWRQTALAHSRLWSKINTRLPPEWIKLFFERADAAPLAITMPQCVRPLGRELEQVQNHLWHTAAISLDGTLKNIKYLAKALARGAPLLTELELTIDDLGGHSIQDSTTLSVAFIKCTPKLHTLRIDGLTLPSWAALPWPNLRRLEVAISYVDAISDLPSLLCGLESASRLETLHLIGCIPSPAGVKNLDKRTVHLPFLHSLGIGGTLENCVVLWNALDAPSVEDFHLDITESINLNRSYHVKDIAPILHEYTNIAAAQGLSPYQTLIINQASSLRTLSISAWRSARLTGDTFIPPEDEPCLRVDLPYTPVRGSHGSEGLAGIENFYKIIGVDQLRALSVSFDGEGAWSKKTWMAIFRNAKRIQTIRLLKVAAFAFSKALAPTITRREERSQAEPSSSQEQNRGRGGRGGRGGGRKSKGTPVYGPLLMQSLESIQLWDVPFDRAYEGKPFYKKLHAWLHERLAAPTNKLTTVIVRNCHVRSWHLNDLRQNKSLQVDWDGYEGKPYGDIVASEASESEDEHFGPIYDDYEYDSETGGMRITAAQAASDWFWFYYSD